MKHIFIISSNFFDVSNSKFTIGGIQTYIKDLCSAIIHSGHQSTLVQFGDYNESSCLIAEGYEILLFPNNRNDQQTFNHFYKQFNSPEVTFVIDTDQRDIKSKNNNVIQIQHGVTFDIPGDMISGIWGRSVTLQRINKLVRCRRNVSRVFHVRKTVCVDYNYFNWFRTQDTIPSEKTLKVIPNYSGSFISNDELEAKLQKEKHTVKIVFARRFVEYRGTRIMINAVKTLLYSHDNISVTFAGDGPLKGEIESTFQGDNRVSITSYDSKDSVAFHSNFDIAVVPTIYSEGTSLSLCEAMAAGCVPIATCVGGMSNILLNGYNGIIIQPSERELIKAIESVLAMPLEQTRKIARRAYDTAIVSFSKKRWEKQWLELLSIE